MTVVSILRPLSDNVEISNLNHQIVFFIVIVYFGHFRTQFYLKNTVKSELYSYLTFKIGQKRC